MSFFFQIKTEIIMGQFKQKFALTVNLNIKTKDYRMFAQA